MEVKLNPFNRKKAEKAAKEYHKQKGQFSEVFERKKILRELKKIKKEKFKEWEKMNLNNDPKCNAFLKKELNPISDKIKKIEDLIERASVEPEDIGIERVRVGRGSRGKNHGVMTGKRGGTYNERTSKNGTSYIQYF